MSKYFYGKVTKSGSKLSINIPFDVRVDFKHRSMVKVFLLDAEELIEAEVVRDIEDIAKPMEIFEAKRIIEGYDKHYVFEGKNSQEIIDYAKHLLEHGGVF